MTADPIFAAGFCIRWSHYRDDCSFSSCAMLCSCLFSQIAVVMDFDNLSPDSMLFRNLTFKTLIGTWLCIAGIADTKDYGANPWETETPPHEGPSTWPAQGPHVRQDGSDVLISQTAIMLFYWLLHRNRWLCAALFSVQIGSVYVGRP